MTTSRQLRILVSPCALFFLITLAGCAHSIAETNSRQRGIASWYGVRFQGRKTANGERFDRHSFSAAHRSLPFGTRVEVRSITTGKIVVVRINDRGPVKPSRILDLSEAAAEALGMLDTGVAEIEFEVLPP